MKFREWLKREEELYLEDGYDDSGSNWFFGNYLRPSDAFDWQYAVNEPQDYLFLQSRWEQDRKLGRKFHGMDIDPIIKQKFVTIKGNTMPDDKSWQHRPDDRPNLVIDKNPWMGLIGIGAHEKNINKLVSVNDLMDKTAELNRTFGPFTPSPPLEADDTPWTKNPKSREPSRRSSV